MEATENRNRCQTRNDEAFNTLMGSLDYGRMELFYQFCNNSRCRKITLLILPLNRKVNNVDKEVLSKVYRSTGIPTMILEYPDQRSNTIKMYGFTSQGIVEKTMTWTQVLTLMAKQQVAHEQKSNDSECANYEHVPQPKGRWNNTSENYRFSNEVRCIPGVRHLDTDGILYCMDCCAPILVVEATSDGCPDTRLSHKKKAVGMTKNVAQMFSATPVLLQHHLGDKGHKYPAYLTTWNQDRFQQQRFSWTSVASWMNGIGSTHQC